MGCELVAPHSLGGGGKDKNPPPTYTEIYHDYLPFYLYIGMPEDIFWNGDVTLAKPYREAHELKRRQASQDMWMQGLYVYDALIRVSGLFRAFEKNPKAEKYVEEPYPITQKEAEDLQRKKELEEYQAKKDRVLAWMESVNATMKAEKQAGD